MDEHCGKSWPHKAHEWLPDWPYALWCACPGSPDPERTTLDELEARRARLSKGPGYRPERGETYSTEGGS